MIDDDPPFEFEVTVTEGHIKNGKPGSCGYCPIALAVKEQFSDKLEYVTVGDDEMTIDWKDGPYGERFEFPKTAVDFISDFDNQEPVGPFKFRCWLNEDLGR